MNRRKFLHLSALTAPLLTAGRSFANGLEGTAKPVVISTWDSGMAVNAEAWKILSIKGSALDAVEAGAIHIENEINCCVGLGGYPDRDGIVTLDSCIMDHLANCGAVAGIERIKHPVSVARKVMEKTPHVILVGAGAQQFALENGFALESSELSDDAKKAYAEWLKKSDYKPVINIENLPASPSPELQRSKAGKAGKKQNGPFAPNFFEDGTANHDTMGLVALDLNGNLSGAVTTSGMAYKLHGRVGDSPIIGAGLFVDNEIGAATSSGTGEEVIRICGTHLVVEFMRQGYTPEMACKKAVERIVKRDKVKAKTLQVGFLAMNKKGQYGAYAIQKGFVFSVKSDKENQIHQSKYLI
jgi:N4-(beta-N-acetylglucosaminyl)-L-asparaginase